MAKKNLRRIKVANLFSFNSEPQEMFFTANTKYSSDKNRNSTLIPVKGVTDEFLLPVTVIYGANASGKSNFIRCFSILDMLLDRKNSNKSIPLRQWPFDGNQDTCSMIEIECIIEDIIYLYSIEFNNIAICSESLEVFRNNRFVKLYSVKKGKPIFSEKSLFSETSKSEIRDWLKNRKDVTILELLGIKNVEPFVYLYDFIHQDDSKTSGEILYSDKKLKKQVLDLLKGADIGIYDINIKKEQRKIPEDLKRKMLEDGIVLEKFFDKESEGFRYSVGFRHAGLKEDIELHRESDGTQKYFDILVELLPRLLKTGGVFQVDEFEKNFHPLLLKQVVEIFKNPKINKAGAQLMFTTHDVSLLKPDVLRRDEIWFIEKDFEKGNSVIYPLSSLTGVRSDDNLESDYIRGKFGAIPFLGNIDELSNLIKG